MPLRVQFRELTSLDSIDLSHTNVSDDGLAEVARLDGLRQLDLSDTRVTSRGVLALRRLRSLESLGLQDTGVGEEVVTAFGAARPQVRLDFGPAPPLEAAPDKKPAEVPVYSERILNILK
jgi:hypothetical protein